MFEYLKPDLTGAQIDTSNANNVDFSEVKNADEAITAVAKDSNEMEIYLKEEWKK